MANFTGTGEDDGYTQDRETRGTGIPEADTGTIRTFGGNDRVSLQNYGVYTVNTGSGNDSVSTPQPIVWEDFRIDGYPDRILKSTVNVSLGFGNDSVSIFASQGALDGGPGIDTLRIGSSWQFFELFGQIFLNDNPFINLEGEDRAPSVYVDLTAGVARSTGFPTLKIVSVPGAETPISFSLTQAGAFDVVATGFETIVTGEGDDTIFGGNAPEETFVPGGGANQLDGRGGIDWLILNARVVIQSAKIDAAAGTAIGYDGKTSTFRSIERFVLGGSDTFLGSSGGDYLQFRAVVDGKGQVIGGEGEDTLDFDATFVAGVDLDLRAGAVSARGAPAGTDPGSTEISGFEQIFLSANADSLRGSGVADLVHGNAGNDTMNGFGGKDILYGGADDDFLTGGQGVDTLYGEDGADELWGGAAADVLVGGEGDDVYRGGGGRPMDLVDYSLEDGEAGVTVTLASNSAVDTHGTTDTFNDIEAIRGSKFGDTMRGGDDDDIFYAGTAIGGTPDSLFGGLGKDTLYGEKGINALKGQGGADEIIGGSFKDFIDGGAQNDKLDGRNGNDDIKGGSGNDDITLSAGRDTIDGGAGNKDRFFLTPTSTDEITTPTTLGGRGAKVDTTEGTYSLRSFGKGTIENVEIIIGTTGNDTISSGRTTSGDERFEGERGNDGLDGGSGDDTLVGGSGDDGLSGGRDNDRLWGDFAGGGSSPGSGPQGEDFLSGGAGDDELHGGGKKDELLGGSGNDSLDGGDGNDMLTGGPDNDTFYFSPGRDVILDFNKDYDISDLDEELDVIAMFGGTYTPGFSNFAAVNAAATTVGRNVEITHREGVLVIEGLRKADLEPDMFAFA